MSDKKDNHRKAELAQQAWLDALNLSHEKETIGTAKRVTHFWTTKLVSGYEQHPREALGAPLATTSTALVCVRNIPFHSMCPHHLVPYYGTVDICYEPDGLILGLGHFERFVEICSRRLILQEPLTEELGEKLVEHITPSGVLIRIDAAHLCQMLNGREPRGTRLTTWWSTGTLKNKFSLLATNSSKEGEA